MTALLVDGPNILMRAIRAMERPGQPPLSADGIATGPLLVFINCLSKHIREERPDKVVVCWDGGRSKFRTDIHPGYKAHRTSGASDFEQGSFTLSKAFLSFAGIHHVERPPVEADDLIAYYWRNNRPLDEKVVILSNDKDFLQLLVPDLVEIVRVSSGGADTDRWTSERFLAERGYESEYEGQVMALMGDSGDGVPGIPGIGPKKAVKIMEDCSWSWLRALDHPKVVEHRQQVEMALRLVDLRQAGLALNVQPLPPFEPTGLTSITYQDLLDFLHRYQLESVYSRVISNTLWRDHG